MDMPADRLTWCAEGDDIRAAAHGLDECRLALAVLMASTGDATARTAQTQDLVSAVASAGSVALVSAFMFVRSTMQAVHGESRGIVSTLGVGPMSNRWCAHLAQRTCAEFGLHMPWFGMRAVSFHVQAETMLVRIGMLIESMERLSNLLKRTENSGVEAKGPMVAERDFIIDVNSLVIELSGHLHEAIALLHRMESGIAELRAAIDAAKRETAATEHAANEAEGHALAKPLSLFGEIAAMANTVCDRLDGLWKEVVALAPGTDAGVGGLGSARQG